jgi:hypothetical protein
MENKASKAKRSPLKRKPLRNPGESIQVEIDRLFEEEIIPNLLFAVVAVAFAAYEWASWYFKWPPQPVAATLLAVLFVGYGTYKYITLRKRFKALRLGLDGEKAVGQYLEVLRSQGCRVFHDILGDNFNIDHVIVSPQGIFVVETKTYSKPAQGQTIVEFDGERILVNGIEPERNAVNQVRALGNWLRDLLAESTGRRFPIKCVIVFPGWFVKKRTRNRGDVWVLNPRALPAFIKCEPVILKAEDIALVSLRISDHMQTKV